MQRHSMRALSAAAAEFDDGFEQIDGLLDRFDGEAIARVVFRVETGGKASVLRGPQRERGQAQGQDQGQKQDQQQEQNDEGEDDNSNDD